MKILQIHHRYSRDVPSGEDAVVDGEIAALRAAGHEVVVLSREWETYSGGMGLASAALQSVWNPVAARLVRATCERERPDLVNVHNTFPSFSPSVFAAAARYAPTVFTVHNYRAFCAAAVVTRERRPCFECLERRSVIPALKYGCYRDSRVSTLAPALMIAVNRAVGTWDNVDAFIALSDYQRQRLAGAGWPASRIHVKPNPGPDYGAPRPWREREPVVVFAGRLSPEKGAHVLIEAWHRWGANAPELQMFGSGVDSDGLAAQVRNGPAAGRIKLFGRVDASEVHERVARARLVVIPSIWPEGFPLILGEALSAGTPAAVSRIGALAELVEDGKTGLQFAAGDAADLQRAVASAWTDDRLERMGAAARHHFERHLAPAPVLTRLLEIYRIATEHRSGRAPGQQTAR